MCNKPFKPLVDEEGLVRVVEDIPTKSRKENRKSKIKKLFFFIKN